jgi:metal-responsive CopG/Arc/MetJ family transcriptional regulator
VIAMRITITIPDKLNENLKRTAANRGMSVSALVSEAVEHYLIVQRRRALGEKVLALAGKVHVAEDIYDQIEEGRRDDRT